MTEQVKELIETLSQNLKVSYKGEGILEGDECESRKWTHDAWNLHFQGSPKEFFSEYKTGIGRRTKAKNDPYGIARPKSPEKLEILQSFLMESEARDMCFQDWADSLGYSSDSIKALKVYEECVQIGIKFHTWVNSAPRPANATDYSNLTLLQKYFQDNPY